MISKLESKWVAIPFGILLISLVATFFVNPDVQAILHYFTIGLAYVLYALVLIPTGIASAINQRKKFLDRVLHFDFVVSLLFVMFAAECANQIFFLHESYAPLTVGAFVGYGWMQWRLFLKRYWQKQKRGFFKNSELKWSENLIPAHKMQRLLSSIGLLGISIILFLVANDEWDAPYFWTKLFACMIPVSLPYFEWIATRLLIESEKNGFLCRNFSDFKNLRNTKLFVLHRLGVLSSHQFEIVDSFIDHSDDWSETEIKELIHHMASVSDHPAAEAMAKEFNPRKKTLVSIEKCEEKPHLGIVAEFNDLQGRPGKATLGEMTWHKILQHEVFPENLERLKELQSKADFLLLLSMNRKILSAIAFKIPTRKEIAEAANELKRSKVNLSVISSCPFTAEGVEESFVEVADNLLPIERQTQREIWKERTRPIVEVKAYWDKTEEPGFPAIVYSPTAAKAETSTLVLISDSLDALTRTFQLSRSYFRKTLGAQVFALGTTGLLLLFLALQWHP